MKIKAANVRLKRAYERPSAGDGTAIDHWAKDIAPSTALRKWFGHDPARWQEFRNCYAAEIRGHRESMGRLRELARRGPVTLVYSAHDETHNDAVVLRTLLLGRRTMQKAKRA